MIIDMDGRISRASPDAIGEFKILRLLGTGNYTEVILAVHGKKEVSIKIIDRKKCAQYKKELDVLMEKHILIKLKAVLYEKYKSANRQFPFPLIYKTAKDDACLYIIQKHIKGDELYARHQGTGVVYEPLQKTLVAQMVLAIEDLHSAFIVHRDLKLENMIISYEELDPNALKHVHIIDFGTALDMERPDLKGAGNTSRGRNGKKFDHWVGSPNFMPPEAIHNKHSDLRNDLWSLGGTIYQLLTGEPPYKAPSDYLVFLKSEYKMLDECPDICPVAMDLMSSLLVDEPEKRLGAVSPDKIDYSIIKSHPYFESIDWDEISKISFVHSKPPLTHKLSDKIASRFVNKIIKNGEFSDKTKDVPYDYTPPICILISILDSITTDTKYKTECIQCSRSNKLNKDTDIYIPVNNTDSMSKQNDNEAANVDIETDENAMLSDQFKLISILSCSRCTVSHSNNEIENYIYIYIRRAIHHIHRKWRDSPRDDGFWTALSDKHLAEADD